MTRQQLIDGIYELDPSYVEMDINLEKYTDEQLQICYDRKMFAPQAVKDRMKSYGNSSYVPKRTNTFEESDIPVQRTPSVRKEESQDVALTGFDALKKGN